MNDGRQKKKTLQQMAIDANTGEDGRLSIACPQCGCCDSRVTNTWNSGGSRKRLRRCRNCGTPITTFELPIPDGYEVRVVPTEHSDD